MNNLIELNGIKFYTDFPVIEGILTKKDGSCMGDQDVLGMSGNETVFMI